MLICDQIQGGHDHVYITNDACDYGFYSREHHLSGHYTNVPVRDQVCGKSKELNMIFTDNVRDPHGSEWYEHQVHHQPQLPVLRL